MGVKKKELTLGELVKFFEPYGLEVHVTLASRAPVVVEPPPPPYVRVRPKKKSAR